MGKEDWDSAKQPPTATGLRFVNARDLLPYAERVLLRERRRVAPLLLAAELSLTGASSHPDRLTLGDVDLHLRVAAGDFAAAVEKLRGLYEVARPEIWADGFAVFALPDPGAEGPVGIAVTAVGTEHDGRFQRAWQLLASDAGLRERYNTLKRAHADGDEAVYLAAKGRFFDEVDVEARRRRL